MPLLLTLIFGMFSGGIAYNRKLVLTNAVREGSRYGATLAVAQAPPLTPACTDQIDCWLSKVASVTQQASEGELSSSGGGWKVCVAYVHPAGTATNDMNRKLERTPPSTDAITKVPPSTLAQATCFDDGRPPSERRVQVTAQRAGKLEYLVSSMSLTLRSQSVTRFEAVA